MTADTYTASDGTVKCPTCGAHPARRVYSGGSYCDGRCHDIVFAVVEAARLWVDDRNLGADTEPIVRAVRALYESLDIERRVSERAEETA